MVRFTLISEGGTDQEALINILSGYFNAPASEQIFFNIGQPERDSSDNNKQVDPGGWREVLKYCASEKFRKGLETAEILSAPHYHIIHIDTDISESAPFNVPRKENIAEYVDDVKQRLIQQMTVPVYQKFIGKIFFAICVDAMECWIIPLYDSNKAGATKGCKQELRDILGNEKLQLGKGIKHYQGISEAYKQQQNIIKHFAANPSFKIFLSSLETTFKILKLST